MCTLSWLMRPDGYHLFLNRDERRTRAAECPPAVRRRGDVGFIAPRDGEQGGTWIAVSDRGIAVCLLNGDPIVTDGGGESGSYTSRGALPPSLIDARDLPEIAARLRDVDLTRFRPFFLIAFAPGEAPLHAGWSGGSLALTDAWNEPPPLISSSFCTAEVRANRREIYRKLCSAGDGDPIASHLAFHASHLPRAGAESVCMHRDDARTFSFSRVDVDSVAVVFHYVADAPCRGRTADPPLRLTRAATRSET